MAALQILDGAVGTELSARGLRLPGVAWSAAAIDEAADLLSQIHRDYAQAGATLHTANTFRTQPGRLPSDWKRRLESAVAIARAAIGGEHRLLGSLAPVQDCYRPDLSPGAGAQEAHRLVAEALAESSCDILLCETFANVEEALTAVRQAVFTGLPVWLSLTPGPFCDLMEPAALRNAADAGLQQGAERVLVNCVAASRAEPYVEALSELGAPFGVYANAGHQEEGLGWGADEQEAAERYAALARNWAEAGATVIGGCCGTGPAHVRALRRLLD